MTEIPEDKILYQRIQGNRVWSILLLKDWPITISKSIYKDFYAVVQWTAWDLDKPNEHETCSGFTEAICRTEKDAVAIFDRNTINQ